MKAGSRSIQSRQLAIVEDLGLRSGFEPSDLDRPGRQPHQQGLCEARLGCRDGSPQLGAPGPESESEREEIVSPGKLELELRLSSLSSKFQVTVTSPGSSQSKRLVRLGPAHVRRAAQTPLPIIMDLIFHPRSGTLLHVRLISCFHLQRTFQRFLRRL